MVSQQWFILVGIKSLVVVSHGHHSLALAAVIPWWPANAVQRYITGWLVHVGIAVHLLGSGRL
jgi:hypothetical protein